MPLTPAHPAVVLPLQRLGLPLSALVVGSVAPDLPVYLPVGVDYQTTHSGWGIAADLVIGLAVLWLWFALLRDAVVDLTPSFRTRAPARARLDRRAWLPAPPALAIGVHQLKRRPVVDRPPAVRRTWLWLVPVPLSALAVGLVSRDVAAALGAALVALVAVAIGWRTARHR